MVTAGPQWRIRLLTVVAVAPVGGCFGDTGGEDPSEGLETTGPSSASGSSGAGAEDETGTGKPVDPCRSGFPMAVRSHEFSTHRVEGMDITVEKPRNVCAFVRDDGVRVLFDMGPWKNFDPEQKLEIVVEDGARLYDIDEDTNPLTEPHGPIDLMLGYVCGPTTSCQYSLNHGSSSGTVDVMEVPQVPGDSLRISAVGSTSPPPAGWNFDFRLDLLMLEEDGGSADGTTTQETTGSETGADETSGETSTSSTGTTG